MSTCTASPYQGFIGDELVCGEAVVQFDHINLLWRDTGLRVNLLSCLHCHVITNQPWTWSLHTCNYWLTCTDVASSPAWNIEKLGIESGDEVSLHDIVHVN